MSQSSEVFINKSKSRRTAARNLSKGNQKTCPFGIKVKPKKLLYFASSRHGFIIHVSHRSKIRLRHTVFFLKTKIPMNFTTIAGIEKLWNYLQNCHFGR